MIRYMHKKCSSKNHMGNPFLPIFNFCKNIRCKDGYHYYCKHCTAKVDKKHYSENKKKIIQKVSDWQKTNKFTPDQENM